MRPWPGTPLLDRRGRVVGLVTSCSIDTEGYQTGQAYLKEDFAVEGTPVLVASVGRDGKAPGEFRLGDKLPVPDTATVLSRFPARKK